MSSGVPVRMPALVHRAGPWALVTLAAAAMILRQPAYLFAPNLWAEEGTLCFAGAWARGPLAGLLGRPAGYLLVYTNAAASLATLVPLACAPFVTASAGLLAQLVPIGLIAFAASPLWGGPMRRAIGIAAALLGGFTGAMWMNALTSQFYFGLATVLVLAEPAVVTPMRGRVYALIVAVAGLSGVPSNLTAPLFVWKAWRTRSRSVVLQAAVLVAGALIQTASLASWWLDAPTVPRFGSGGFPAVMAAITKRAAVLPVLGVTAAERTATWVRLLVGPQLEGPQAGILGAGLAALLGGTLLWLARGLPPGERWWLPGSFVIVSVLSVVGAVGGPGALFNGVDGGQRYFYIPSVVLLILLLHNVRPERPLRAGLCAILLAFGLATGAARWQSSIWWRPTWASWSDEVSAWQADPGKPLRIWPPGWVLHIAPR